MDGSIPASVLSEPSLVPVAPASVASAGAWRGWWSPSSSLGFGIIGVLLAVALCAGRIAPGDPFAFVAPPLRPPSSAHPMGTDDLGRDLFSCVVHGARTSLLVALAVTVLTSLVGITVGATAGWRGARLDDVLMRVTEFVQVVPRFSLAIIVIALIGPGLDRLVVLLGLTSWPLIARVVRAEVLSLRTREFVDAARSLGARDLRIVRREILPGVVSSAVVVASVNAASVILLEAGLSFLGLGDPAVVSWGYLASNAQRFLRVSWWMVLFPGAAIALAVLGLNLVGDALNDVLNPRLDGARDAT